MNVSRKDAKSREDAKHALRTSSSNFPKQPGLPPGRRNDSATSELGLRRSPAFVQALAHGVESKARRTTRKRLQHPSTQCRLTSRCPEPSSQLLLPQIAQRNWQTSRDSPAARSNLSRRQ